MILPRIRPVQLLRRASSAAQKQTRAQRIQEANYQSELTLHRLNVEFGLFSPRVTKVVDLGYLPGSWSEYARRCLLSIHGIDEDKIQKKCTLIAFDLLFGRPMKGVLVTQGNIYSQLAHTNIINLLKEAALRHANPERTSVDQALDTSYLLKEIKENEIETELGALAKAVSEFSLNAGVELVWNPHVYQADLVMSDLSAPFLQESGFYNNTSSRPYIRSSVNAQLRKPLSYPEKASIDLAEAALLLCCEALSKNGTFVARLAKVNMADPELGLLESRLRKMFRLVSRWSNPGSIAPRYGAQDLYMVCQEKRESLTNKYELFGIKRATNNP